jgi:hypothetical protein
MFRIHYLRLLGLFALAATAITLAAGCNEVLKFHPATASWTAAEAAKVEPIIAKIVVAGAKAKLMKDAYTTSGQFKFTENKCTNGTELITGMAGKEECTVKIKLEGMYVKERASLVLEGKVEVNGKGYEGKEESTLVTR